MGDGTPGTDRAQAPDPDTEFRRALTDNEVRELGYSHRDEDGRWVRIPDLERRSRTPSTRSKPTHVLNPDAMADAIRDAGWNRPTIGAVRRRVSPKGEVSDPFDWTAVRRRADEEHARAIADVLNPRREVPRPEASRQRVDNLEIGPAYAARALHGEAEAVATAPVGRRAITLNTSAWTLARPELDGIVDADDIEAALVPAAVAAGLNEREAVAIVRGALRRRRRA
jgi:hypothetical protein